MPNQNVSFLFLFSFWILNNEILQSKEFTFFLSTRVDKLFTQDSKLIKKKKKNSSQPNRIHLQTLESPSNAVTNIPPKLVWHNTCPNRLVGSRENPTQNIKKRTKISTFFLFQPFFSNQQSHCIPKNSTKKP